MAGRRLIDLQFKQDVGVRAKFGANITAAVWRTSQSWQAGLEVSRV